MMEIWFLFFLIGLSAQQETNDERARLEYAYLRPTSLRFVQLQLVNGYIGHPVGQVKPWLDSPTGENQQNVATLGGKKVQIAQKPYILLRPAPVTVASTAGDYGDNYERPIKQSRPWYGAAIYELLPASVPKDPAPATNQKVKLFSGGSTPLVSTTLIQSGSAGNQPVRQQKPWFGPATLPADEPEGQPLIVSVPSPLIATLVASDVQDKPVRGQKPWFGPPYLPAEPEAPQVDPQPTVSISLQEQQPVRGHKPWFGPPFLPADPVVDDTPVRASAVPLPSPLHASLVQEEEQPVRGQKPWFGPPILAAEDSALDDSPEIQPTAVILPSPLIATLVQPEEQPVRGQKPWFGPPILQADGFVEESLEIRPSAVALPSPLIATLIHTEEEPTEIQTEKPVRGHKPWFGPPFLPADPVKQPKPIIVDESAVVADAPVKQPKPIIDEDGVAIEPSAVSVPRPLIATLMPGEFPHVGAAQRPAVVGGQNLITTTPVGGGPVTIYRPTTITVYTAPICLVTAGGQAGPVLPPGQTFPPPCPARKRRSDSEEFILVDGKKFSPTEVEKLLSTAKPNFEEFGEDRRTAAMSLASLTSSMDEEAADKSPSPSNSRTQRLLPAGLAVTSDLTIPVYAPSASALTSTVTIGGACVPRCLAAAPQCVV